MTVDASAWDDHEPDVARAVLIREFETRLLELFSQGELNGTVHTCIGQEMAAVAVARALGPDDMVFSNHRGHGHFLALDDDVAGLLAEVMGRATGVCGGVGGSQHLAGPRFLSNGVQAGMTPIAVGHAIARRRQSPDAVSVVFIGDGTLGEGLLYESLNLATVMGAPVLFVLEDNGVAQSTDTATTTGGSIEARAEAFGLAFHRGSTAQWPQLFETASEAVDAVRSEGRPALLAISTYRLMAHSKGDDNRDPEVVAGHRQRDPLELLRAQDAVRYERESAAARAVIDEALAAARLAPVSTYDPARPVAAKVDPVTWRPATRFPGRHVDRLHQALADALSEDPRVLLLGEDVEGPYGGAFKVTRDLSASFPGRVLNMPISEAAIVGCGTGLAVAGYRPIVEIMFGDFLTLTMDQVLQHAAKFEDMFGGAVRVPLMIRTPMGARRGYGPTHSQSVEKFFLGIPGLTAVAPNLRVDPGPLYAGMIARLESPVLVVENKTLYTRFAPDDDASGFRALVSSDDLPTVRIDPVGADAVATVVCYGGMLEEAEEAQRRLFDLHEIAVEIVCPTSLYPLDLTPIVESVRRTARLVVVEEGPSFAAFGAEVMAQVAEAGIPFAGRRRGYSGVIPASAAREGDLLVDAADIVRLVRDLVGR